MGETAWKLKKKKWNWRVYLTEEEKRRVVEFETEMSSLREKRQRIAAQRLLIVNRAISRAKTDNPTPESEGE